MKNLTYLEFKNELPMLTFTDLFSLSSCICSSLADAEDVKMSKTKYSPSRSSRHSQETVSGYSSSRPQGQREPVRAHKWGHRPCVEGRLDGVRHPCSQCH